MIGFSPMEHVILFIYILIFSTGFAAIVGLGVLYTRLNRSVITHFMAVQILFIANLGLVAGYYYAIQVLHLVSNAPHFEQLFAVLATLLSIALYITMMYLIARIPMKTKDRSIRMISLFSCAMIIAMQLLRLIGSWDVVQSTPWTIVLYVVVAVAMGSFGSVLLRAISDRDHRAMKTLLRGIGISCIAFIPLSIIEYIWQNQSAPLSLEYLLYLGINGSILAALVQVLAKNPKTSGPFQELSDEAASRFSLTKREQQMATLIAQGMTNKEIAFALHISEATVRTHIYHLFQTVGAQSRIELLKILHS